MTVAVQSPPRPPGAEAPPRTTPAATPPRVPRVPPARHLARGALLTLAALLLGLTVQLLLISPLQYRAAQQSAFDTLRASLAEGTSPVAQTDAGGHLLTPGTPVALLDIPKLHLRRVAVLEGTDSRVLSDGPGHRRDTPMPGQAGTSVIFGRAAAYGGPFGDLRTLEPGDTLTATTGQGRASYRVTDVRVAGDPAPPTLAQGKGRLVLVTATGSAFLPAGVLRVDAEQVSAVAVTPAATIVPGSIPGSEQPLASGDGVPWELVMWLQALVVVAIAAVWAWHRWGRHQTWIVCAPVVAVLGLQVAAQVTHLLPNLL
ncbi:sortase [Streptomyces sp. NPDC088261]|uniref:sortase n=1 Tax=Streptomyces sp. NPDC088261 TaxID=3365851 RepID=UPI003810902C